MAITEASRYGLQQRLHEVLGAEEASTLMEHLPPVGWADIATRADLLGVESALGLRIDAAVHELRTELAEQIGTVRLEAAGFRAEVATGFGAVAAGFGTVRTELGKEIGAVRMELGQEIGGVRLAIAEQSSGFQKELRSLQGRLLLALGAMITIAVGLLSIAGG